MGMQTIEERTSLQGHRQLLLQKIESPADGQNGFLSQRDGRDEDAWKVDESWTSIIGYIAELSLPGEG